MGVVNMQKLMLKLHLQGKLKEEVEEVEEVEKLHSSGDMIKKLFKVRTEVND